MMNFISEPPHNHKSPPPRQRAATHSVYQLIEDGESQQVYKMKVGNAWAHPDSGDVHRVITIHGEFEINRIHPSRNLH